MKQRQPCARPPRWLGAAWLLCGVALAVAGRAAEPCRIEVVDQASGWPVPLVEFRTTHQVRLVTDNAGLIAFDLPELMNVETWFDIIGHGYEVPKDGFGMHGLKLKPQPGKTLTVKVKRTSLARRLGRITGGGLLAESQKLGQNLDWPETGVLGCDSVQNAIYQGRLFWAWGDTTIPGYPLGIFDGTSATTSIRPLEFFEPPLRLKFDYFRDARGKPRGVASMPGSGPSWITGYASLPDKTGKMRLVTSCMKIRNHLEIYQWVLAVWNDEEARFDLLRTVWTKTAEHPTAPNVPQGHAALWKDAGGREWVLFGNPLPTLRCPATFEAWQDSSTWETLKPQASIPSAQGDKPVKPHSGAMAWNDWRKRWVSIFVEAGGKPSSLGEVWYAEAESPTGPWSRAIKVLSHQNYTFYNPVVHPEMTPADSPILLFEGTYTEEFANHPPPTPRYNYNQILYRLDLDALPK